MRHNPCESKHPRAHQRRVGYSLPSPSFLRSLRGFASTRTPLSSESRGVHAPKFFPSVLSRSSALAVCSASCVRAPKNVVEIGVKQRRVTACWQMSYAPECTARYTARSLELFEKFDTIKSCFPFSYIVFPYVFRLRKKVGLWKGREYRVLWRHASSKTLFHYHDLNEFTWFYVAEW